MIEVFRGKYAWLSNFAECEIIYKGVKYLSVEHAYMSAKSKDPKWKEYCRTEPLASNVKKESGKIKQSKKIKLIKDWDDKREEIMKELLSFKFSKSPFKEKLISTGSEYIQEGNTWNDLFWGVDLKTGLGENVLGLLIMQIRDQLNREN